MTAADFKMLPNFLSVEISRNGASPVATVALPFRCVSDRGRTRADSEGPGSRGSRWEGWQVVVYELDLTPHPGNSRK